MELPNGEVDCRFSITDVCSIDGIGGNDCVWRTLVYFALLCFLCFSHGVKEATLRLTDDVATLTAKMYIELRVQDIHPLIGRRH